MDAARLALLRELGDRGSVTAVAAALHVSPSAVSQQLAALQAQVAVPLTTKQGRRLVLTAAGQTLATASTRVEQALVEAREAVAAFLDEPEHPVSVAAFHSAGLALFGPLLQELDGSASVALVDADVAQDRFPGLTADHDLVIAHRLPHDPEWPLDRHVVVPLLVEPLDIALPAAHPLAAQRTITPEQLRDENWVSVHEGFPLAGVLQHIGAMAGRAPRIAHRINEFSVAAQVVRAGVAIAVMPRITAASLAADGLVLRPLDGAPLVRHVDALARPEAVARASVRRVLDALRAVARRAQDPARSVSAG